jgi:hypothetical protein
MVIQVAHLERSLDTACRVAGLDASLMLRVKTKHTDGASRLPLEVVLVMSDVALSDSF